MEVLSFVVVFKDLYPKRNITLLRAALIKLNLTGLSGGQNQWKEEKSGSLTFLVASDL